MKRICPICGKEYSNYPALSRRDNETEICPDCGIMEAIEDCMKNTHQTKQIRLSLPEFSDMICELTSDMPFPIFGALMCTILEMWCDKNNEKPSEITKMLGDMIEIVKEIDL